MKSSFMRLPSGGLACLLLLGSCGNEGGANSDASTTNAGGTSYNQHTDTAEEGITDNVASVEAISAGIVPSDVPRIDGYPVEDNVPKSAYPAIRRMAAAKLDDLDRQQAHLVRMNICLGRWDDPIGNGERIRTWHLCDESSIWTNPDYEARF